MKRKIGFGIIGAGMIAELHAKSMETLDNAELAFSTPMPRQQSLQILSEEECIKVGRENAMDLLKRGLGI